MWRYLWNSQKSTTPIIKKNRKWQEKCRRKIIRTKLFSYKLLLFVIHTHIDHRERKKEGHWWTNSRQKISVTVEYVDQCRHNGCYHIYFIGQIEFSFSLIFYIFATKSLNWLIVASVCVCVVVSEAAYERFIYFFLLLCFMFIFAQSNTIFMSF